MKDKAPYIQKFRELYKEIYNLEFTDEQAERYFDRMVNLYKIFMGVLPECEKMQNKQSVII